MIHQRITIINIRKPVKHNLNAELQWFGSSLGLFNLRDKDKSCFRLFIELLKAAKMRLPLTSDELAFKLQLSRGTIIHHLNKLIDAGLVVHQGRRYMLRDHNLQRLMHDIKQDFVKTMNVLEKVAKDLDDLLGI